MYKLGTGVRLVSHTHATDVILLGHGYLGKKVKSM